MPNHASAPVTQVPPCRALGEELRELSSAGLLVSLQRHRARDVLPRHQHGGAYLCVVLSGGYEEESSGLSECRRGSLVVHPAGHSHANRFGSMETRCANLHFDARWLDDRELARLFDVYRHVEVGASNGALHRLERALRPERSASHLEAASAALELVCQILSTDVAMPSPAWLTPVTESIAGDLARLPNLPALASLAGLHPAHLCRAFRKATGETIGGFSRRLRLEAAERMLADGRSTAAEIAAATGFYDQSHLGRHFKRRYGTAPVRHMQNTSQAVR